MISKDQEPTSRQQQCIARKKKKTDSSRPQSTRIYRGFQSLWPRSLDEPRIELSKGFRSQRFILILMIFSPYVKKTHDFLFINLLKGFDKLMARKVVREVGTVRIVLNKLWTRVQFSETSAPNEIVLRNNSTGNPRRHTRSEYCISSPTRAKEDPLMYFFLINFFFILLSWARLTTQQNTSSWIQQEDKQVLSRDPTSRWGVGGIGEEDEDQRVPSAPTNMRGVGGWCNVG